MPTPAEAPRKNAPKTRRGKPFERGNRGRPKGALNRVTRAVAELFEADAERVGAKAVELALAGDATALRLVIERVYPAPRERRISVALPAMRTLADLPDAVGAIIVAVGEGKLTTTEAAALAGLLAAQREAIEAASVESRLAAIEERLADEDRRAQH